VSGIDRPTTDMLDARTARLKRENTDLQAVNEVLQAVSAYFAAEIERTPEKLILQATGTTTVFSGSLAVGVCGEGEGPIEGYERLVDRRSV